MSAQVEVTSTVTSDHVLIIEGQRGTVFTRRRSDNIQSQGDEGECFMAKKLQPVDFEIVEQPSLPPQSERELDQIKIRGDKPKVKGADKSPKKAIFAGEHGNPHNECSRNKTGLRRQKTCRGPLVILDGQWIQRSHIPFSSVYPCGKVPRTAANAEGTSARHHDAKCGLDRMACLTLVLKELHKDILQSANEKTAHSTTQKGFFPETFLRTANLAASPDPDAAVMSYDMT